jgi:hypothetical protein
MVLRFYIPHHILFYNIPILQIYLFNIVTYIFCIIGLIFDIVRGHYSLNLIIYIELIIDQNFFSQ